MKKLWIIAPVIILVCIAVLMYSTSQREQELSKGSTTLASSIFPDDPQYRPSYAEMNECMSINKDLSNQLISASKDNSVYYVIAGLFIAFLTMIPSWIELFRRQ